MQILEIYNQAKINQLIGEADSLGVGINFYNRHNTIFRYPRNQREGKNSVNSLSVYMIVRHEFV